LHPHAFPLASDLVDVPAEAVTASSVAVRLINADVGDLDDADSGARELRDRPGPLVERARAARTSAIMLPCCRADIVPHRRAHPLIGSGFRGRRGRAGQAAVLSYEAVLLHSTAATGQQGVAAGASAPTRERTPGEPAIVHSVVPRELSVLDVVPHEVVDGEATDRGLSSECGVGAGMAPLCQPVLRDASP
jgi:hypothetical protein